MSTEDEHVDLGPDVAVVATEPRDTRVVLLADNRDRANVGCRATSIALSSLLERSFTLTGAVGGSVFERPLQVGVGARLPGWDRAAKRARHRAAAWNLG